MFRKAKDFIEKIQFHPNYRDSALILIIGGLIIITACVFVNSDSSKVFIGFLMANPLLLIVNLIPVILMILFLFFATNNGPFSIISSGAFFIVLGIVNKEKIRLRQDPLFPTDIKLLSELVGIAKGFTPKTIIFYTLILLLAVGLIVLSIILFKSAPIKKHIRLLGVCTVIVCAFISNKTIYSGEHLYASFPVEGNQYFEVNQYNSKGYIYCFLHKYNTMKVVAPEGYSVANLENYENDFAPLDNSENEKLPHIIMIMGEAYSDLSENANIDFSSYGDPMKNWKEISSGDNAISGHIIVPNFGGGTSDTEFDVLTALPTRFVNSASNSYSLIRKPIDAIPGRLKEIGYDTLAIHPGFSWFYNRLNVFNYMGFDRFIHLESFQGSEKYKGGYIADKYATDCIIETFEEHISQTDRPLFQFTVTIENHGPYDEKYDEVQSMFETDVNLTENEKALLDNYFTGIYDADIEIKRLTDYFERNDEPVVFVYFGDHLPGFSNGMDFFEILDYDIDANGSEEQLYNVYKTPFMIWQNAASKDLFSLKEGMDKLQLPADHIISSNFLGALTLEFCDLGDLSPLTSLANSLRKEIPLLDKNTYKTIDGDFVEVLDTGTEEQVNLLKQLVYYKLFDE